MKRLIYLGLMLMLSSCSSMVSSTTEIDNLQVMTKDLGPMNWWDASIACAKLGPGWRLPTKEELNILYEKKWKIWKVGVFKNEFYWSSTEWYSKEKKRKTAYSVWGQNFENGFQFWGCAKHGTNYFRAVRYSPTHPEFKTE